MVKISWPELANFSFKLAYKVFLDRMAARIVLGELRYGKAHHSKNYMTRLYREYRAYKSTGNQEHLTNIANYAFLESVAPENHLSHYDNTVGSVTRSRSDV